MAVQFGMEKLHGRGIPKPAPHRSALNLALLALAGAAARVAVTGPAASRREGGLAVLGGGIHHARACPAATDESARRRARPAGAQVDLIAVGRIAWVHAAVLQQGVRAGVVAGLEGRTEARLRPASAFAIPDDQVVRPAMVAPAGRIRRGPAVRRTGVASWPGPRPARGRRRNLLCPDAWRGERNRPGAGHARTPGTSAGEGFLVHDPPTATAVGARQQPCQQAQQGQWRGRRRPISPSPHGFQSSMRAGGGLVA